MRPPPEKNRIMLDFYNKIRYFFSTSARQHVSTSARQHVSTSARQPHNCVFNQHKKFHPLFQLSYPSSAITYIIRNLFLFIHPMLPRPDG